jgi:hypothetical protein
MRYCENCDIEHTNVACPKCGARNPTRHLLAHDVPVRDDTLVSDPPDRLDTMIEAASRPTLASLVKQGIKRGLITPVQDYASRRAGK